MSIGLDFAIPDIDEIEPTPGASGFVARQAFQFAIFGEKGSLEEVLLPLAECYEADLYLPSGEISNSLLYRMAKDAVKDRRPLVVFTVSDCDPSGRQMPISIGRKLQALRDLLFPDLQFEVVPAALTVEQVRDLDLPSTPLKETEKRASRWRKAFGVEQTEIDALATLRPDALREIIDRAFDPYFDRALKASVDTAEQEWLVAAQEAMVEQINNTLLPICASKPRHDSKRCAQRSTASMSSFTWSRLITLPCPKSKCLSLRLLMMPKGMPWSKLTRIGCKSPGL